jgi:hypothetical protein
MVAESANYRLLAEFLLLDLGKGILKLSSDFLRLCACILIERHIAALLAVAEENDFNSEIIAAKYQS